MASAFLAPEAPPKGYQLVRSLVPRASWAGCDRCWKEGVAHNGHECAFGGPCYIRLAYCEHRHELGFRLRPDRRSCFRFVTKDKLGRWIWYGYRKKK